MNVLDPGNLPIEHSWPPRLLIAVGVLILVTGSAWLWLDRRWVLTRLFDPDAEPAPPVSSRESVKGA